MSSCRDFRTTTLLLPVMESPFVPPVAPACFSWPLFMHYLWSGCSFQPPTCAGGSGALPHQSLFESSSCREVGESHSGCVHHSTSVWSVGCICNHRSPISVDMAAGEMGPAPLPAVPAQGLLVSVALDLWPSQAWLGYFKSPCQCFAGRPVLLLRCCQASASESAGQGAELLLLTQGPVPLLLAHGRPLSAPFSSTCPAPVTTSWVTGISQTLLCYVPTHKGSLFKWKWIWLLWALTLPKFAWTCLELLFGLFLCLTCASKCSPSRPSCCPHQRQKPLRGTMPIWIFSCPS